VTPDKRRWTAGLIPSARPLLLFLCGGLLALAIGVSKFRDEDERYTAGRTQLAAEAGAVEAARATRVDYGDHPRALSLGGDRVMQVRSLLNVDHEMRYGSYVWDEKNIPAGPVQVRVDLARQTLSVFRGGHEIGSAVIIHGSDGKPTPLGSFHVLEKNATYHSLTYDAPMPYMLRLTDDGVAIHGSNVRRGWATHGCVGVPLDFARLLFKAVHRGDTVSILPASPDGIGPISG